MSTRRGEVFFWIAQMLLLPALLCFVATIALHLGHRSQDILKFGSGLALLQVPCAAMAFVLAFAAGTGGILTKGRVRTIYAEVVVAALLIAGVFLMRDVYRPQ